MTGSVKVLFLFGLCLLISTKVDGSPKFLLESADESDNQADRRGIIGNILNDIRQSHTQTNPLQPVNIPSPAFYPDQGLAPTFQVPVANVPVSTVTHRPSLIGGLLNNIFNSNEAPANDGYNRNWLNYALQKCARINPTQLTAILPTTANGLSVPKMYYFQNDTTGALTWSKAQEWCTSKGMNLLTVNDASENKVIVEKLRQIMASNAPGTAYPTVSTNPTAFWIGLNGFTSSTAPSPISWVGDGTSTFVDWHTGEPALAAGVAIISYCGNYDQAGTVDNIRMDARDCLTGTRLRFICEVSDDCMALFMSRYPTTYFHHHDMGHGHLHYSPGGVLPGK